MTHEQNKVLMEFLLGYITPHKAGLFKKILEERTRYLTVVLEDIYQAHNTSAVIRSCEAFGVQDVHIIENKFSFEVIEDIALGGARWLDVHRYQEEGNNTAACLRGLKEQGFAIIGTLPVAEHTIPLNNYRLTQKTALVLGTEKKGMSEEAKALCDGFITIPMSGFTESLNLSVCAAICLQQLTHQLRTSELPWRFTEEEKLAQMIEWSFIVSGHKEKLLEYFNKIHS